MIAIERTRASVEEVQESVRHLSDEDRAEFWRWYWEMDGERWDEEFEEDAKAGRLDWLATSADKAAEEGKLITFEEGFNALDEDRLEEFLDAQNDE